MTEFQDDSLQNDSDLEIIGFLSYGILHECANTLTRIQLYADYATTVGEKECREQYRCIVKEVDSALNKTLLNTWFSPYRQGAKETGLDFHDLTALFTVIRYSCRRFLVDCRYTIDEGARVFLHPGDLGLVLVFPVIHFCTLGDFASPGGSCSIDIGFSGEGETRITHSFFPSSRWKDSVKLRLSQLKNGAIKWSISSDKNRDNLILYIPSINRI